MLFSGLSKGVLMLVMGAAFTWILVVSFENRAQERASVNSPAVGVPSMADAPGKRGPNQWQF